MSASTRRTRELGEVTLALRKSDLYNSLWSGADELRGGMDASQYKDYVLTLLFVKYVSDKAKADQDSLIYVPDGGSFDDLLKLKGKSDIGEQMNIAIRALAEANDLQGVINNADWDDPTKLGDGKAMVDRLGSLLGVFQGLDFTGSKAEGDDLLGDAYEYLMRHFATESGKSKGQFYTPSEVSRVIARLLEIKAGTSRNTTVYDATCGSGSLLLKVADAAPNGLTIYGQEMDNATWALARMNMILHGNVTADIRHGNTLADPKFLKNDALQTFDYIVANPPFSVKSWTHGVDKERGRFDGFGRPPEKNGDYAFLLHMVKSLKSNGKAAVILPHGVLFRGNAEATIRTELVKRGYIKAVVGLPGNLFYGTGIPACILVLDKENAQARTGIFMVDASKGFVKDGNKNRLRPRDMHKIVDVVTKQIDVDHYSRMVPLSEIQGAANDFNLNITRYLDSSEPEDVQDLDAHLKGGIPDRDLDELAAYWEAFPSLRSSLFTPLRTGYSELAVEPGDVRANITGSSEHQGFADDVADQIARWWTSHRERLELINATTRPVDVIDSISEDLLLRFIKRPLIDEYGVYERLMQYWNSVLHDDVTMVVGEGWVEASRPREARIVGTTSAGKPKYEDAHIVFGTGAKAKRWVMDLIPPHLIIDRYFSAEKAAIEKIELDVETATQAIADFAEEHVAEGGLLFDAADDEGKVTLKLANDRLRAARREDADDDDDELEALKKVIELFKAEAAAKKALKEAQEALALSAVKKYGELSESDVQTLVLDDKWFGAITSDVRREVESLTDALVRRLEVLGRRYGATVGELEEAVAELSVAVAAHLAAMGFGE